VLWIIPVKRDDHPKSMQNQSSASLACQTYIKMLAHYAAK